MIIHCCVYNCDQGDSLDIANVIVDDKFEIGDVDKCEIVIVEISVRILLILILLYFYSLFYPQSQEDEAGD